MNLDSIDARWARWTITADADLDGAVEVAFTPFGGDITPDTAWHDAEWDGEQTGVGAARTRTVRCFVAGPDADVVDGVVLPLGESRSIVKITDGDEVITLHAPDGILVR